MTHPLNLCRETMSRGNLFRRYLNALFIYASHIVYSEYDEFGSVCSFRSTTTTVSIVPYRVAIVISCCDVVDYTTILVTLPVTFPVTFVAGCRNIASYVRRTSMIVTLVYIGILCYLLTSRRTAWIVNREWKSGEFSD